jgi:signal transduction histidine kinase
MNKKKSIKQSVAKAFTLFAVISSTIWGLAVLASFHLSEDRVIKRQLEKFVTSYQMADADSKDEMGSFFPALKVYRDPELLPVFIRERLQDHPGDRHYEFQGEEFHVLVVTSPNSGQTEYFVYDVSGIEEASSSVDMQWFSMLLFVIAIMIVIAVHTASRISKRALQPISLLAQKVSEVDPQRFTETDWQKLDSLDLHNHEVSILAGTLARTMKRTSNFIERELNFTRAASHEMRTPLAVIEGSLSVLRLEKPEHTSAKSLDRIEKATGQLRSTVDFLLLLSREPNPDTKPEPLDPLPVIQNALKEHSHMLSDRHLGLDVNAMDSISITTLSVYATAAISRFVKCTYEIFYSESDRIYLNIDHNGIAFSDDKDFVTNGTPTDSEADSNSAFNLDEPLRILCARLGWNLTGIVQDKRFMTMLRWQT